MGIKRWLKDLVQNESTDSSLVKFSPSELSKATKKYSRKVGTGGFAEVFHGVLEIDGEEKEVAVKKMMKANDRVVEQVLVEREVLGRLSHPNLVKLYGYSTDGRMLVYEFLPGGDVDTLLDDGFGGRIELPWERRLDVALDTARGLAYLHENDFVHRDFKPSNVLLDADGQAKVTDFGIARRASDPKARESGVVTRVIGTRDYMDPEYSESGILHPKSDVFSFGVLLIELLTGVRVEVYDRTERRALIKNTLANHKLDFVDPKIKAKRSSMGKVAVLAVQATSYDRDERPTMADIVAKLEEVRHKVE